MSNFSLLKVSVKIKKNFCFLTKNNKKVLCIKIRGVLFDNNYYFTVTLLISNQLLSIINYSS